MIVATVVGVLVEGIGGGQGLSQCPAVPFCVTRFPNMKVTAGHKDKPRRGVME